MKISDPLQANDWDFKDFFIVVLLVQAAMLAAIGVDSAYYSIPILRKAIVFIDLTFIPGYLILRALNLHNLGRVVTPLYAIGLSIFSLMFVGVFLNTLLPLLGIGKPLTLMPLAAGIIALILMLLVICFIRDRKFSSPSSLDLSTVLSPPAILLYILPLLTVMGAYLMNLEQNNLLIVILILTIALIVLLVGFNRFIPSELFPLAILSISISLVFHNSLISTYLSGMDIQVENYVASTVLTQGFWNSSTSNILNAMLSIVMVPPIYSIMMNMDIVWVFKIIFPLFLALVPVGLYEVFRKQSDEKIGFMAAFFFSSMLIFYTEMLSLARQELAELFLVLVILLVVDMRMGKLRWTALFVIFSISLALSHYGLMYIYLGSILLVWAMIRLSKVIWPKLAQTLDVNKRLTIALILSVATFCLIWYIYTAGSNPFNTIVVLINKMAVSFMDLLNPNVVQSLSMISSGGSVSLLHKLFLYLMLFTQFLILVGVVAAGVARVDLKMTREFYVFSVVNLLILIAGLTVPYFASALNTTRLYQISLIFLAFFFIVGWVFIVNAISGVFKRRGMDIAFKVLAVFLVVFLFFNTGLVFEVFHDASISYSLNSKADNMIYSYAELDGARWIVDERNVSYTTDQLGKPYLYTPSIYSDMYRSTLFDSQYASQNSLIPANFDTMLDSSFIYLGKYNIASNEVLVPVVKGPVSVSEYANASDLYTNRSLIYNNGGSEVYGWKHAS